MDGDRNSFYGSRNKVAFDPPSPSNHDPDTASSFFIPDRTSRANVDLMGPRQQSAGYNSTSFAHAGREEPLRGGRDEEEPEGGWDVFADFNNTGPRYSTAFGQRDSTYQKLPAQSVVKAEEESVTGPVEMVTVPALGPEWQRSELRDLTKTGRKEKKSEARRQKIKQWMRDEQGLCGTCLTRKVLVYVLFGLCILAGIIVAITIPRVPSFSLNERQALSTATGAFNRSIPSGFSRLPANFSFPAYSALQVDTTGNYVPITFSSINAQIFDLDSDRKIGTGYMGHKRLPPKAFPVIQLPLNFSYVADNDTDPTWLNWYNGCRNRALYPGSTRPGVRFRLVLSIDIAGLPGRQASTIQTSNANCPIELPQNSV